MCSALTVKRSQTRANTWCRTARPTKHEDAGVRSVSYTPHHGNVTKSICHCIRKTLYEKHVLQLHSETCDPCATDSHRACFATGLRTLLTSSSKSKVCWLCRRFWGAVSSLTSEDSGRRRSCFFGWRLTRYCNLRTVQVPTCPWPPP